MREYFTWNNSGALNWLWLAPVLVAVVWYAAARRDESLSKFLGQRYDKVAWRWHRRRRLLKGLLLVAAYCLVILAAARPRVGSEMQKVQRHGADVIFLIDTSSSMLAQDVRPSRLDAAKEAALALINRLAGDRVGIVVFAGSAYMYSPLTIDHDAASMFVSSIERGSAPAPGTALEGALASALRLLQKAEHKHKAIVLFSDGEDHPGVELDNLKAARGEGVRVHVVGFGGPEGAPIPVQEGEQDDESPLGMFESIFGGDRPKRVKSKFKQDAQGETVLTKMNEKMLSQIARDGGGVFVKGSESGANIDRVYQAIAGMESGVVGTYEFSRYAERFQWPLGLAILLLVAEMLIGAAPRRRQEVRGGE